MLVFRLFRVGKNNQPSYKIVVTDKRNPSKGGRFVEQIGFYNPVTKEKVLNKERVQYWLSQGVQPSATLHNLFIKDGILEGKKIPSHKKSKKPVVAPEAKMKEAKPLSSEAEPQAKEVKGAQVKEVVKEVKPLSSEAEPLSAEALGRSPATGEAPKAAEKPADKPAEPQTQPKEAKLAEAAAPKAEEIKKEEPAKTEDGVKEAKPLSSEAPKTE